MNLLKLSAIMKLTQFYCNIIHVQLCLYSPLTTIACRIWKV